MNEHEQIITIAEACGWTLCVFVESIGLVKGFPPPNNPTRYGTYENGMAQLPSYLTDLNAMHDAEQKLWAIDWNSRHIFTDHLANIISGHEVNHFQWGADHLLDATAAERAEAFLRTIGKWAETNSMKAPTPL
jgi:hypothetical protein